MAKNQKKKLKQTTDKKAPVKQTAKSGKAPQVLAVKSRKSLIFKIVIWTLVVLLIFAVSQTIFLKIERQKFPKTDYDCEKNAICPPRLDSSNEFYRTIGKSSKKLLTGSVYMRSDYGVEIANFKNGKLDGLYKRYSLEGKIEKESTYKMGALNGLSKEYLDGKLFSETIFEDDHIWKRTEYSEGKIKLIYENGRPTKCEGTLICTDDNKFCNCYGIVKPAAKPIIYLYPEQKTEVSVKVGHPEKFTHTYPHYIDGWNVIAQPNGDLTDVKTGRNLYALYWEGKEAKKDIRPKEGFIVKGEDTIAFLEDKLAQLGLSEREANEFIIYWLPKLEDEKYNYIRFKTMEEQNENMPLFVEPKPDTIVRVMMEYDDLDEPIDIKEQILPPTPQRKGFTLVEWGGTEIDI